MRSWEPERALVGRCVSEQAQLLARSPRRTEMLRAERRARPVEAELLAGQLKAPADHPRDRSATGHALAPAGVVILAAAGLADEPEHMLVTIREICHQPFAKQVAHLQRQSQQHVAGLLHAHGRRGIENALDLLVVERGDHRRHHDGCRRAGVAARGSMTRASLPSSVVTDSATLTRLRSAMRARMSRSRVTSDDLVTMPTGWPHRSSTSRIRRMIWC